MNIDAINFLTSFFKLIWDALEAVPVPFTNLTLRSFLVMPFVIIIVWNTVNKIIEVSGISSREDLSDLKNNYKRSVQEAQHNAKLRQKRRDAKKFLREYNKRHRG